MQVIQPGQTFTLQGPFKSSVTVGNINFHTSCSDPLGIGQVRLSEQTSGCLSAQSLLHGVQQIGFSLPGLAQLLLQCCGGSSQEWSWFLTLYCSCVRCSVENSKSWVEPTLKELACALKQGHRGSFPAMSVDKQFWLPNEAERLCDTFSTLTVLVLV